MKEEVDVKTLKRYSWFILLLLFIVVFPISVEAKTIKTNKIIKAASDGTPLQTQVKITERTVGKKTTKKLKRHKTKAKRTVTKKETDFDYDEEIHFKGQYKIITKNKYYITIKKYLQKNKKKYAIKKTVKHVQRKKYIKLYCGEFYHVEVLAPKLPNWLVKEFHDRNLKFIIDPELKAYSDYPNLKNYNGFHDITRGIDIRYPDKEIIYHEFGHFLANVDGDVYSNSEWINIFKLEKKKCKTGQYTYGIKSPVEYFATNYVNYVLEPKKFKKECPKTYTYIKKVIDRNAFVY